MEIAIIAALAGVVKDLYNIANKVQENKEQCLRLCLHINSILDVLEEECKNGAPPMLSRRIIKLSSALLDLTITLESLYKSSFLQRIIWRKQVAANVQELYRCIVEAVQDVKLGIAFDVSRAQAENEQARQVDAANTRQNFDRLLNNDKGIIGALEVQQRQMQEAVVCLQRYLEQIPDSSERRYLENDVFVITSLDVIIHYDKKLGEGGFTRVYEGLWKGTKIAVKVMEKGVPASAIQQEVDVWKRLRHPHILEFYGACSIADPPFMVCAYKDNGDAVDFLRRFPNAHRRQLLYEAAIGLFYLHENGVVHGDIKASNILIDQYGRACLSDFGLSQIKIHTTTLRGTGNSSQHGTARWMAPEHMLQGVTSKRTDVYSFGMTMYEVFTGFPPFAGTPETMLLSVICDRRVRPVRPEDASAERNGLNGELWALMCQSWAHEPELRPVASHLSKQLARHAALVRPDVEDERLDAARASGTAAVGNDIPVFWRNRVSTPPSPNHAHARRATVHEQAAVPPRQVPSRPGISSGAEHRSVESHRVPPLSPHGSSARSRLMALETPSMQSLISTSSSMKGTPSRPGTRQSPEAEAPGSPYVSRAARELIEFLDEGPPEEDKQAEGETIRVVAQPSTPKKASGLSQLPHRIRMISRRQKNTDEKVLEETEPALYQAESPSKSPVSPDVRELIDFLEEGPPEDVESSTSSSKPSSPSGKALLGKLQPFSRNPRRQRPKNLSLDVPALTSLREPHVSPHSPDSRSSESQPYISKSARDLVEFLNEGPPLEMRIRGRRQRDGSVASEESAKSKPSVQKLRDMLSRGHSSAVQGTGGESTELLLPSHSRPPSVSSLDMFMLPLPGVYDDSPVHAGPIMSPSDAQELAQRSTSSEKAGASVDSAAEPSRDISESPDSSSTQGGALVVAQLTPVVNIAAPALVVFSSVVLYMLFSTPFS